MVDWKKIALIAIVLLIPIAFGIGTRYGVGFFTVSTPITSTSEQMVTGSSNWTLTELEANLERANVPWSSLINKPKLAIQDTNVSFEDLLLSGNLTVLGKTITELDVNVYRDLNILGNAKIGGDLNASNIQANGFFGGSFYGTWAGAPLGAGYDTNFSTFADFNLWFYDRFGTYIPTELDLDQNAMQWDTNFLTFADFNEWYADQYTDANFYANMQIQGDLNIWGDLNIAGNFDLQGVQFIEGGIVATGDSNFTNVGVSGGIAAVSGNEELFWNPTLGSLVVGSDDIGGAQSATGVGSIVTGWNTGSTMIASGDGSFAGGRANMSDILSAGEGSFAYGYAVTHLQAAGWGAISMGLDTKAFGRGAVALGYDTNAVGQGAFAVGSESKAIGGTASIVLGDGLTNYEANSVLVQDLNVLGDLNVSGNAQLKGDLNVWGDLNIAGDFDLQGVQFVEGGIIATGDSNFVNLQANTYYSIGNITTSGDVNAGNLVTSQITPPLDLIVNLAGSSMVYKTNQDTDAFKFSTSGLDRFTMVPHHTGDDYLDFFGLYPSRKNVIRMWSKGLVEVNNDLNVARDLNVDGRIKATGDSNFTDIGVSGNYYGQGNLTTTGTGILGQLAVGTTTPEVDLIVADTAGNTQIRIVTYSDTVTHSARFNMRKSHTDSEAQVATVDTDVLGEIYFTGVDGAPGWSNSCWIKAVQDGAPSATKVPGYLSFYTTSTTSQAERMRILKDGGVNIIGDLNIQGDLNVTGDINFGGQMAIQGISFTEGGIIATGDSNFTNIGISEGSYLNRLNTTGNAQLGDATTDYHGINTTPTVGTNLKLDYVSNAYSGNVYGIFSDLEFTGDSITEMAGIKTNVDYSGEIAPFPLTVYGGYFGNSFTGAATEPAVATFYGIRATATGNLGTTGTTTHYGGRFRASGTADNSYGLWVDTSGATSNKGIVLDNDSYGGGLWLGEGQDAVIYYDGTHLRVNPKVVGAGNIGMLGNIDMAGNGIYLGHGGRLVDQATRSLFYGSNDRIDYVNEAGSLIMASFGEAYLAGGLANNGGFTIDSTRGATKGTLSLNPLGKVSFGAGDINAIGDFNLEGDLNIQGNLTVTGDFNISQLAIGSDVNNSFFNSNGFLTMTGGARVTRHLNVGAASWKKGATAPTEGFSGLFPHLSFADNAQEEAHYSVIVPSRWDETTDIEVAIDWYYTGAQDNGNVVWAVDYLGIKAGEDPTAGGTSITKTTAGNHTTGQMVRTTFTTEILAANLEEYDIMALKVWRNGTAEPTDDLTKAAIMLAVHIHFTENKLGAAS